MPYFNSPIIRGDLYITFNIIFPENITIDNDVLIEGGFGEPLNIPTVNEIDSDIEVYELVEKDPEVSYSSYKDTIKEDVEEDEGRGMPQGGVQQCAQQ